VSSAYANTFSCSLLIFIALGTIFILYEPFTNSCSNTSILQNSQFHINFSSTNVFNIQQLYALSTLYLCVLYLTERLVPLTA
jgi:hypothetical protein